MPEFTVRKMHLVTEEIRHDGGPAPETPRRLGAILACVRNPFAGRYEPDLQPAYHPGYFKETGFHHIRILQRDPLFRGFRNTLVCLESHYCEVKTLPKEFVPLAATDECSVQAYRHRSKPLYGVQFHPEGYTEHYPDGRKLLANFFRLARTKRFARRRPRAGAG